jgi:hypothetical protein
VSFLNTEKKRQKALPRDFQEDNALLSPHLFRRTLLSIILRKFVVNVVNFPFFACFYLSSSISFLIDVVVVTGDRS